MRSVEEHQRVVAELIAARPATTTALADAEGLALADDVTATVSLPVFDNSAMDGYAVRADEVAAASADHPVKLPVAEDIPAGRTDIPTLEPGTAHRIMTGAPMPAGATAVVPVENTDGRTDVVSINAPTAEGVTSGAPARTSRRARRCCGPGNWSPRRWSGWPPRWDCPSCRSSRDSGCW